MHTLIYPPQKDCSVVSQLIRMAKHARRLELGLKPSYLYVSLTNLHKFVINLLDGPGTN